MRSRFRDSRGDSSRRRAGLPAMTRGLALVWLLGMSPIPALAQSGLELLRTIAAPEGGEKIFGEAGGAYFDADGTLYVTDIDRGKVHVFATGSTANHLLVGKDKL